MQGSAWLKRGMISYVACWLAVDRNADLTIATDEQMIQFLEAVDEEYANNI